MKKESFPYMPPYCHEVYASTAGLSFFNQPTPRDLVEKYDSVAIIELDMASSVAILNYLDSLFHRFLGSLHSKNALAQASYFPDFEIDVSVGPIEFPDGFIHPQAKLSCYKVEMEHSTQERVGIMIINHDADPSKVYGILRIAQAFRYWLKQQHIAHLLMLFKLGERGEGVEIKDE